MSSAETVTDLWQEYKYGLNAGPSLEYLEQTWGTQWRSGKGLSGRKFNRRWHILKRVLACIAGGAVESEAIRTAELDRGKRTLNKYAEDIVDLEKNK